MLKGGASNKKKEKSRTKRKEEPPAPAKGQAGAVDVSKAAALLF